MVERYSMSIQGPFDREPPSLEPDNEGDYVRYSDYAALEDRFVARIEDYEATIARLQEQVETLRKERDEAEQAEWATKDWFWSIADRYIESFGPPEFPDPDMSVNWKARAEAAEAERDRLREALRETDCPRPCNGRPDDFSAGDCFDAGECGCGVRAALQKEHQP